MKPRSVRLTDAQRRFINQSNFEFTAEVRDWLEGARVRNSAGVCAMCGDVVYIGGHVVTSGGSPMGNALNLGQSEEIDTCDDCHDDLMDGFTESDGVTPDLQYYDSLPNYYLYRAERDAVADAQPDSPWAPLVTHRDEMTRDNRIDALHKWLETIDFEKRYNQGTKLDAQTMLDVLYREQTSN